MATRTVFPHRARPRKPTVKRDDVSLAPATETDSQFMADDRAVAQEGVALFLVDDDADALYFND